MRRRIFLVDDHPVARQGLRMVLENESDLEVCGEAADVPSALDGIEALRPELVVTDLELEHRSGLDVLRAMQRFPFRPHGLVVSMYDEVLYAHRALRAGAQGYAMKRASGAEVVHAVREVLAGRIYLSGALRQRENGALEGDLHLSLMSLLTDRELEVFLLLGEGYAPRHIADKLHLSPSTVEVYRQHLKEKLNLESSALLGRYAVAWCRSHVLPKDVPTGA